MSKKKLRKTLPYELSFDTYMSNVNINDFIIIAKHYRLIKSAVSDYEVKKKRLRFHFAISTRFIK